MKSGDNSTNQNSAQLAVRVQEPNETTTLLPSSVNSSTTIIDVDQSKYLLTKHPQY